MNDLEVIGMIKNFPIGGPAKDKIETLSKAGLVAFLSRFQEQFSMIENIDERESVVKEYLGNLMSLEENEKIPNINEAARTLSLSSDFIQDYSKVQMIKENNPAFTATFEMIASNIDIVNYSSKSM